MWDSKREAKIRRMLGTSEALGGGFIAQREGSDDVLPDLGFDLLTAIASAALALVVSLRRRLKKSRPADTSTGLPYGRLAVGISGEELLVGRRGKVLIRRPAFEVLRTAERPLLATEFTIDGEPFVAPGVEGDEALRLRSRVSGAAKS